MSNKQKKEKAIKAVKIGLITLGVAAECGIIFLAYLGGGQLAQDYHHDVRCDPTGKRRFKDCVHVANQNAMYGWDRLFNLGWC